MYEYGYMSNAPVYHPDMQRHGPPGDGGISPLTAGLLGVGFGLLGGSLIAGGPSFGPGYGPPGYGPIYGPPYGPYGPGYGYGSGFDPYGGYPPGYGFGPYGY